MIVKKTVFVKTAQTIHRLWWIKFVCPEGQLKLSDPTGGGFNLFVPKGKATCWAGKAMKKPFAVLLSAKIIYNHARRAP
jgi:hypothetical protein